MEQSGFKLVPVHDASTAECSLAYCAAVPASDLETSCLTSSAAGAFWQALQALAGLLQTCGPKRESRDPMCSLLGAKQDRGTQLTKVMIESKIQGPHNPGTFSL